MAFPPIRQIAFLIEKTILKAPKLKCIFSMRKSDEKREKKQAFFCCKNQPEKCFFKSKKTGADFPVFAQRKNGV